MFTTTALLPAIFTLSTLFGVFVHDSQLDRAAMAVTAPTESNIASTDNPLRQDDQHPHSEIMTTINRTGNSNAQLTIQPRSVDRKYALPKRTAAHSAGSTLWPSS